MTYFRRIFFTALLAGLLGGIFSAAVNIPLTVPLILKAEVYEQAEANQAEVSHIHEHEHEATADARDLLTLIATLLAYVGFSLLLSTAAEAFGMMNTWRSGLIGGVSGFLVFSLLPAIGLPPELPGMPAADLGHRQLWWLGTAVCAAAAIIVATNFKRVEAYIVSLLLVVLPFVVGAPHAPETTTLVPSGLHHEFVASTLVVSLMTWALIGTCLGWLRGREGRITTSDPAFV
jgi:cobalt transporter subunit CbtA